MSATASASAPAVDRGHPARPRAWSIVALGLITLIYRYAMQIGHPTSWHFFRDAATGLLHGPGLDLYAVHPEFQFGPLAAVVAIPFQPIPHLLSRPVIATVGSALGVVTLLLLERLVVDLSPGVDPARIRRGMLWATLPVLFAWSDIAIRNEHIDDALALAGIIASALYVVRRRPWLATLLMAVAVAAKPWAVVCVPMLAAYPGRGRVTRPLAACAAAGATWVPFIVDAPRTLSRLAHFSIENSSSSGLRAIGVATARTPHWDRPAQLLLGLAAALLLVRLDRWWAVPMSALGIRLLLDPGTHRYYTAGLALAVLVWELVIGPRRIPWRTIITVGVLETTATEVPFGHSAGRIRLAVLLAVVTLPMWESWRGRGRPTAGGTPSASRPRVRG